MTNNERSNRRRFLEGAVCACLHLPPRHVQFSWEYSWLHVKLISNANYLSYYQLHQLVEALDRMGFQTESGQILIYEDASFVIRFFDPFDELKTKTL